MKMDGWQDRLHTSFLGEHFLFGSLRLESTWTFLIASLLTVCFCLSERALTLALSKQWNPFLFTRRSRFRVAMWRSALYWIVTFIRLIYMLAAMSYHLGIILVTVTALSVGQFVIEYVDTPPQSPFSSYHNNASQRLESLDRSKEPLLNSSYMEEEDSSPSIPLSTSSLRLHCAFPASPPARSPSAINTRIVTPLRSKPKPNRLFIHPTESNLVRAEAFAIQHGLAVGNDLVDATSYRYDGTPVSSQDKAAADRGWGGGKGRETARELLGGSDSAFHIGNAEE